MLEERLKTPCTRLDARLLTPTTLRCRSRSRTFHAAQKEAVAPSNGPVTSANLEAPDALKHIQRVNPMSDKFEVIKFHHIEWWCSDATSAYNRFGWGLGMQLVAKSDQSTSNSSFASYVLKSNELVFTFTAPYSTKAPRSDVPPPLPYYNPQTAIDFQIKHGMGVRAVGVVVADAKQAYERSVAYGAVAVQPPIMLRDKGSNKEQTVAEILLYGDCVLRFVSGDFEGQYLAGYTPVESPPLTYGLQRLDHAVGNVHDLQKTLDYICQCTGFHQFAEFTAEDVGTVDSGLNSTVLANNNEFVILPVNEPTFGTPRKSQIQTYLEQNEGPGLQHLALKTDNIFTTLRQMKQLSAMGGFKFMPRASEGYYRNLHQKVGDILTPEQYREVEELGILVDRDDQGVLLQIFTQPVSDRPTVFLEIIQRIGCMRELTGSAALAVSGSKSEPILSQAGGCGGFGKGNFGELFKSIEDYERTLSV